METGPGGGLPIDMKQLMFNNLQLLGLDAQAMEASNHIPFNKLMFDLPNKRGAEIVLHFLFQRLNPTMCKEAFRDCWPIHNKKTEQNFRKICSNWLANIAKDDPDSHLPRINASLFMSPGGEKFYQLLFHFSGYVLQKSLEKDLGVSCSEMLKYPSITSQNLQLGEVMKKNTVCSSVRHRNGFFSTPQLTLAANTSWRETVDEFVKKNRKLSKEIRELEYKTREEEQTAAQSAMSRGSPIKSRGDVEQFDPNFDPRVIKRAQKIQKVRDMWKQLDDFEHSEAAEREVIESIVENTVNKHRIDATDITIKVPDMLLRECAEEIRRRNVDNTYHCGKLNLVSVIQLWNLCLHLYLEKLQQVGVPKFKDEVNKLESQCHTQQTYLHNAQALREEMQERIPELKSSVESLRERLDEMFFKDMTPTSVRSTSLGYGLVEPSPQMSFSPEHGKTPAGGIGIPRDTQQAETPDAVAVIAREVETRVRQGPAQLFNDVDLQLISLPADRNNSAIPVPHKKSSHASSSRASSQQSTPSTSRGSKRSQKSTPKNSPRIEKESFPTVSSPLTMVESVMNGGVGTIPGSAAVSHRDRLTPTDFLVEEIMGESEVLSNCTSGLEAFKSHIKVARTPDLVDEKENMQPSETFDTHPLGNLNGEKILADTSVSRRKDGQADIENAGEDLDQLSYDDIYRLEAELSARQRDSSEIGIPGPELDDEYDNEISEEKPIVIDRSFNALQEENQQLSFDSPRISDRQDKVGYSYESPPSSPGPIIIDKSIHLSPTLPSQADNKEKLEISHSSGSGEDLARYQPVSPARKDEIIRQKLANSVRSPLSNMKSPLNNARSPLSDEIRKMFQDALADTRQGDSTSEAQVLPRSLSGSSRNSFVDQVQLEGLVVGESIERRDSDYFPRSSFLTHKIQQLQSDRAQSPKVDDILARVKAMEERMLGRGTPLLGSSSDLELPVMDPNSRIPDSDDEGRGGGRAGVKDISWEHTENLEDIEMPDLDLDIDDDDDGDTRKDIDNDKESHAEPNLNYKPVNLDEFFESKTPELPKRAGFGIQSESLQSTDSNVQLPKFPQMEDESPLITFTP